MVIKSCDYLERRIEWKREYESRCPWIAIVHAQSRPLQIVAFSVCVRKRVRENVRVLLDGNHGFVEFIYRIRNGFNLTHKKVWRNELKCVYVRFLDCVEQCEIPNQISNAISTFIRRFLCERVCQRDTVIFATMLIFNEMRYFRNADVLLNSHRQIPFNPKNKLQIQ